MTPSCRLGDRRPYPTCWNLIPLLGGLLDPFAGVFTTFLRIFRHSRPPATANTPDRLRRGLVLLLGGMEGPSRYATNLASGLLAGGYPGGLDIFDWNAGWPLVCWYRNLTDRTHHESQSARLAARIHAHAASYPGSPLSLIAHSSGCWVVLRALAKLTDNMTIDRTILLAPSVSPGFHLGPAATRCRRGLWSVGGPGDYFFLGMGTAVLGTSDRVRTPSAGWIGWHHFDIPGFRELRWHPDWIRHGYLGNHTSCTAVHFAERVLAPALEPTP